MVLCLFAFTFIFAFVTADAAKGVDLGAARIALFILAVLALLGATAMRGGVRAHGLVASALSALLLIAALAVQDGALGSVDLLDYRILIVVLVMLIGPSFAEAIHPLPVERIVWSLLALYVAGAGALALVAGVAVHGQAGQERYDFTGSVVTHAALCAIFLCASLSRWSGAGGAERWLIAALASLASAMLLLTATRTGLLTVALWLALFATIRPDRLSPLRLLGGAVATGVLIAIAGDALLGRLIPGGAEDYSSGRWHSQAHWIALALDRPLGLGFGAVREILADGRPFVENARLLEWPHNEPIRFFVEGGILGLLLVLLIVGSLLARTLSLARHDPSPARRGLALAVAADLFMQTLLQNYFNSIYHAACMVMVLVAVIGEQEMALSRRSAGRGPRAAFEPNGRETPPHDDADLRHRPAQDRRELRPAHPDRFSLMERLDLP